MAIGQASESFVPEYFKTLTEDEAEIHGLGILVANQFDFDGLKILKAFYDALEDANFHSEADTVLVMIEELENDLPDMPE